MIHKNLKTMSKIKGQVIMMVGAPQTGKSYMIKEMLKQVSPESIGAVDLNDEYNAAFKTYDFEELLEVGLSTKNKTLIFEEATSYFQQSPIRKASALLSKSMGHLGHNVFLCFHNLNSVPAKLLPFINHLYYTKTIEKNKVAYPLDRITKNYTWYSRDFFYNS